jgi:hypothetical protein
LIVVAVSVIVHLEAPPGQAPTVLSVLIVYPVIGVEQVVASEATKQLLIGV